MVRTYDTILLLAGENPKEFPRSKRAVEIFSQGKAGSIFVTGGVWGLASPPYISDGKRSVDYIQKKIVEEKLDDLLGRLFFDYSSHETAGNYTFPIENQLPGNPNLADFSKILVIIEEEHLKERGKTLAEKTLPQNKLEYEVVKGSYKQSIVSKVYSKALLTALRHIREPNPKAVHQFLLEKHPFYQEGWFEKPIQQRKQELAVTCIKWLIGLR